MASSNGVAPVIIKRKKVVGGGGHHGGAWKVAMSFPFGHWADSAREFPPKTAFRNVVLTNATALVQASRHLLSKCSGRLTRNP